MSGPWNELLNALFQSTKSPEPAHRESAFRVFAALPSIVDKSHVDLLRGVFLEGLQDRAPQVPFSREAPDLTPVGSTVRFQSRMWILCRF